MTVERNPFYPKYLMSVGDTTVKVRTVGRHCSTFSGQLGRRSQTRKYVVILTVTTCCLVLFIYKYARFGTRIWRKQRLSTWSPVQPGLQEAAGALAGCQVVITTSWVGCQVGQFPTICRMSGRRNHYHLRNTGGGGGGSLPPAGCQVELIITS